MGYERESGGISGALVEARPARLIHEKCAAVCASNTKVCQRIAGGWLLRMVTWSVFVRPIPACGHVLVEGKVGQIKEASHPVSVVTAKY